MQVGDLAKEYQAKTDDELLQLATDAEQLTTEARTYLNGELVKRGIHQNRALERPQAIASGAVVPGREQYTIGPVLAAERPKPPWRPKVAGTIAFFFGPFAGAQVASISLRRMGYREKAKKALYLAFGIAAGEAVILFFLPDALTRLVGIVGEIVFWLTFPKIMEHEFAEWHAANPDVTPSSGWNAIGWGFLGLGLFFVVAVAVMIVLGVIIGLLRT